MSRIATRIRGYVNGPPVSEHYGEWGALRPDQRRQIRELCDTCDMFEKAADEFAKRSKWISVDEKLPDNDGKYLVAREECGRYSISVRKFRKEVPCWYTGYCGHWERRTNGITHWMPLPEAPKMKGGV